MHRWSGRRQKCFESESAACFGLPGWHPTTNSGRLDCLRSSRCYQRWWLLNAVDLLPVCSSSEFTSKLERGSNGCYRYLSTCAPASFFPWQCRRSQKDGGWLGITRIEHLTCAAFEPFFSDALSIGGWQILWEVLVGARISETDSSLITSAPIAHNWGSVCVTRLAEWAGLKSHPIEYSPTMLVKHLT